MRITLTSIFLTIFITGFCQSKSYHTYSPNESGNVITRWNLPKDSVKYIKYYVEETTDRFGRVVELKFFENGRIRHNTLCGTPDIVKFFYPNDYTIVQSLFNYDGTPLDDIECETNCKTTFTIDKQYKIMKAQVHFCTDKADMVKEGLTKQQIAAELSYIKKAIAENTSSYIPFYLQSYSKFNRHFPMGKKFSKSIFSDDANNNVELTDALKCLNSK